ncbi:MAG: HNH endonuclease signature motif containing protein [Sulfitobacter sp.]
MAIKALPEQSVLLQLLRYEPETGKLFWRERGVEWFSDVKRPAGIMAKVWNTDNAGSPALDNRGNGYRRGKMLGQYVYAHRVVWKMVHAVDPDHIDHINGDRADNRIINLRSVVKSENNRNLAIPRHNTSGRVGVSFDKWCQKWVATIYVDGKSVKLGRYASFDDAVSAREKAEKLNGYHKNHGDSRENYT